jgi:predicted permease
MSDRWLQWCRKLAPESLRDAAFDPAAEDLIFQSCVSRAGKRGSARLAAEAWFRFRLLVAAIECRRLAAVTRSQSVLPWGRIGKGTMSRDLITSLRRLWREPRFTVTAVLTLALGLGANLAVFTFVDAFLLAPLPVPDQDSLVRVYGDDGSGGLDTISYPNYRDGRDMASPAIDLATHAQTMALIGPADSAEVRPVELVSGNFFRVLRLVPQAGRFISDADDTAELASPVAVISDRYWRSHFDARSEALGQTLLINGATFQIIGVSPAGFDGTFAAHRVDVWVPVTMQAHVRPRGLPLDRRGWGWLSMFGRLQPTRDRGDAERALATAAADINRRFPPRQSDPSFGYLVRPLTALSEDDRENLAPVLLTAFAFTGLLFLATCANLASLMHARVASRRKEYAIRQSLGAGRLRLMSEWMAECVLLALAGGAAALVVARLTAMALGSIELPLQLLGDMSFATSLQWRVVAYTFAVSLAGAVIFGLGSAWRAARQVPVDALTQETGTTTGGKAAARGRRALVALQVGVSVLLMMASLLATSLKRQLNASPGFETASIGLLSVHLQRQRVPAGDWRALTERALEAARSVPGVAEADIATRVPLEPGQDRIILRIPGYDVKQDGRGISTDFNQVGAGYFRTMGIPFVSGGPWDPQSASPAVVVNRTFAQRYWGTDQAVGKTVLNGRAPMTVAGVVADTAYYTVGETPRPFIFLPAHVQPPGGFALHIRAAQGADTGAVTAAVAKALAAADSRLASFDVMTFNDFRQVPLFPSRLLTMSAMSFGAVSILLTVFGLFGVIASSVASRTREIGVRLALGAEPDWVQRAVIGDALRLAAIGAAIGLAAGYVAAFQLRSWLFDVGPFNPGVTTLVVAVVALAATLSAWIPARRASRIDPVQALK